MMLMPDQEVDHFLLRYQGSTWKKKSNKNSKVEILQTFGPPLTNIYKYISQHLLDLK